MKNNWVGVHTCGGLIRAIPNASPEKYVCSVGGCSGELPNSDYVIITQSNLPEYVHPVHIESLPRDKRASIAQTNSKHEAIELAVEAVNNSSSSIF